MSDKERNDCYFDIDVIQKRIDKLAKKLHNSLYMYEEGKDHPTQGLTKIREQLQGLGEYVVWMKSEDKFIDTLTQIRYLESSFESLEGSYDDKHKVLRRSLLDCMNQLTSVSKELPKHVGV